MTRWRQALAAGPSARGAVVADYVTGWRIERSSGNATCVDEMPSIRAPERAQGYV